MGKSCTRLKIKQPQLKQKLLVSKELAHFSEQILKKCLCGSLEHPNVMQAEDVSEQLTTERLF
jgi:exonuclease SbcC